MFNFKKDEFKYEAEVNSLIREATQTLNQRLTSLEIQNNQLILQNQRLDYELNLVKNNLYVEVQRLEKRITDFTDYWHPIMTENINRIKTDLEKTIAETERKDIKQIQNELEINIKKSLIDIEKQVEYNKIELIKQIENEEPILIGYKDLVPVFINKDCSFETLCKKMGGRDEEWIGRAHVRQIKLYINKIKYLKNISIFDLSCFNNTQICNNEDQIICSTYIDFNDWLNQTENTKTNNPSLKKIYDICTKNNIKFVIKGQNKANGIPFDKLFNI